jgi:hypothetical protein
MVCCVGERTVNRWETVAEARRDGVFARGWVPDILPDSATALVGLHDLDTNARCAGARFQPRERRPVRDAAEAIGFVVHEGERPSQPFTGCPFLIGNIVRADEVWRRDETGASEFLILTADGQMHDWSAGTVR